MMVSHSLTVLVGHFLLISFARLTISYLFAARNSSIFSNLKLQSYGPTLSILSIPAAFI